MKLIKYFLVIFFAFGCASTSLTQVKKRIEFFEPSNRADVAVFYTDCTNKDTTIVHQHEFQINKNLTSGFNYDIPLDLVDRVLIWFEKNETLSNDYDISFDLLPEASKIITKTARVDTVNRIELKFNEPYTGRLNAIFKRK